MAVDKAKVIARLKVLFPKANLSQKRLDALADKLAAKPEDGAEDPAIDVIINSFNDIMSIEEIAKEDDRIRTLEAQSKSKPVDPTNPEPAPTNPPTPVPAPTDAPAWVTALLEQNKTMLAKVEALESGKVKETKQTQAQAAFEKSAKFKNLPEAVRTDYLARINLDSETPFEEQVTGLEANYETLVQHLANTTGFSGQPLGTGGNFKPDEKLIDSVVDSL